MTEDQLLALCGEGIDLATSRGADEAEVMAAFGEGSGVEFEKNDLHLASSDDETSFGVRVILGSSVGFATSNDPETLSATVDDAIAIAKSSLPDPHNQLPAPAEISSVEDLCDEAVAGMGVGEVTRLGAELLERIRERDTRASIDSGGVWASRSRVAIRSSLGTCASEESTYLGGNVFGMAVDGDEVSSFVVEGEGGRARAGFEDRIFGAADRFVDKALGGLGAGSGESYKGPVLFTPEAVSSLLVGNIVGMMSSPTLRKGKSPLIGRLGERIAAPSFQLFDDATRPGRATSSSFDREGQPRRPLALIENGVYAGVPYNHYEALAAKRSEGSSGHASGGASALPSVGTTGLSVAAGDQKLADILAGVDRCVIVTRFSGSTNPVTGAFSGVVKSGSFREGGEERPVSEILIAGELLQVLDQIIAVSSETQDLFGRSVMPWILADGVSVTAG